VVVTLTLRPRFNLQNDFLVLISITDWGNPKIIVQLERLGKLRTKIQWPQRDSNPNFAACSIVYQHYATACRLHYLLVKNGIKYKKNLNSKIFIISLINIIISYVIQFAHHNNLQITWKLLILNAMRQLRVTQNLKMLGFQTIKLDSVSYIQMRYILKIDMNQNICCKLKQLYTLQCNAIL
jgi:hypothetical protein